MKFFDRKYAMSELDDDEYERRQESYKKHLEALKPKLPADLLDMLAKVKFHDARIELALLEPEQGRVTLELFCFGWGSHWRTRLIYGNALLISEDALRAVVADPKSEVMYQEIDIEDSRCLQRFIVCPSLLEFQISFQSFACEASAALPSSEKPRRASLSRSP